MIVSSVYLLLQGYALNQMGRIADAQTILFGSVVFIVMNLATVSLVIANTGGYFVDRIILPITTARGKEGGAEYAWFVIGLVSWGLIGSLTKNFSFIQFSLLGQQSVFATAGQFLNPFWANFLTTIIATNTEEGFFLLAVPAIIILFLRWLSEIFPILKNKILQLLILISSVGGMFAYFHVLQATMVIFILSAFVFRAFLLILTYENAFGDFLPGLTIAYSFSVSVHFINNVMATGVFNWFGIMLTHPLGWLTLILYGLFCAVGIEYIIEKARK